MATKDKDKSEDAATDAAATDAAATDNEQMLVVTAKIDGFRRAGREWHGVTKVPASELTKVQLAQLVNEPNLHIQLG